MHSSRFCFFVLDSVLSFIDDLIATWKRECFTAYRQITTKYPTMHAYPSIPIHSVFQPVSVVLVVGHSHNPFVVYYYYLLYAVLVYAPCAPQSMHSCWPATRRDATGQSSHNVLQWEWNCKISNGEQEKTNQEREGNEEGSSGRMQASSAEECIALHIIIKSLIDHRNDEWTHLSNKLQTNQNVLLPFQFPLKLRTGVPNPEGITENLLLKYRISLTLEHLLTLADCTRVFMFWLRCMGTVCLHHLQTTTGSLRYTFVVILFIPLVLRRYSTWKVSDGVDIVLIYANWEEIETV